MILLWGLKKIPLLLEIPVLKDHLTAGVPAEVRRVCGKARRGRALRGVRFPLRGRPGQFLRGRELKANL